jgi:hypothetical protein
MGWESIVEIENIVTVDFNRDRNYILLNWKSFKISLRAIVALHEAILEFAVTNGCRCYVANTLETRSTLPEEVIGWWRSTWIRRMEEGGIELIVTILPENIIAQQSTFEWQTGAFQRIRLVNVISLAQAEKIISSR